MNDINSKQKKLFYYLGNLLFELHKDNAVRFLYTTDGAKQEEEVEKVMGLLAYLDERKNYLQQSIDENPNCAQEDASLDDIQNDTKTFSEETSEEENVEEDTSETSQENASSDDIQDNTEIAIEENIAAQSETETLPETSNITENSELDLSEENKDELV